MRLQKVNNEWRLYPDNNADDYSELVKIGSEFHKFKLRTETDQNDKAIAYIVIAKVKEKVDIILV